MLYHAPAFHACVSSLLHASCVLTSQQVPQKYSTLQMKGRWESNINGWFQFMYSQKLNCYYKITNYIVLSPSSYFPGSVCLYSAAWKYVDRSWEYMLTDTWMWICDWGHTIPRKGIHKWDFPCSACQTNGLTNMPIPSSVLRQVACMFRKALKVTF